MDAAYPQPRVASLNSSLKDLLRPFRQGPAFIALLVGAGACLGAMTALVLFATKPLAVALPIGALLLVMPTFLIRDKRQYWLGVFLFAVQFEIQKNLNDGLAVRNQLNIDYTLWHFTFQIHATDVILAVLMFYWYVDTVNKAQRPHFPRAGWLVIGFFACCVMSLVAAPWPYLGLVEIWRQLKFFLVFLYIANNVKSKAQLRLIAVMAVAVFAIQGAVTLVRYETGWMQHIAFGDARQDEDWMLQYLSVDRDEIGEQLRSFGTLGSPGSTLRLCMLVLPFPLLLGMRNPMFPRRRLLFLGIAAFGMGSLLLTFTRAYILTTPIQLAVAVLLGIRHRYLTRMEVLLLCVLGLIAAGAAAPKVYEQLAVRRDSVTVRLQQYKATFDMIVDNPVFGVGLNNGTGLKERYVNVSFDEYDADTQFYLEPTHNLYLSLASEIGLIGTMLYFAFFATAIARIWRVSNTTDPDLRFFANALLVALAGLIVNSLYDPMHEDAVMTTLWMYCGLAFALTRMADRGHDHDSAPAVALMGAPSRARIWVRPRRAR